MADQWVLVGPLRTQLICSVGDAAACPWRSIPKEHFSFLTATGLLVGFIAWPDVGDLRWSVCVYHNLAGRMQMICAGLPKVGFLYVLSWFVGTLSVVPEDV